MTGPSISILVPVRDEEVAIGGLLEAIAAQDQPVASFEVLLIDGVSQDATVAAASLRAAQLRIPLRVIRNPAMGRSPGLNAGLAEAGAPIVVRLDARSRPKPHYVRSCVRVLEEHPEVGVVGGSQVPEPRSARVLDYAIARALSNRYTTGLARYRRGGGSGPTDTVWMGVFRTAELRAIGGWNESVDINEDFELNLRYRASGAVIWFEAGLDTGYLARSSLRELCRQYFAFGRAKGTLWRSGMRPSPRQLVLVVAPLVAGAGLVAVARRHRLLAVALVPASLLMADVVGSRKAAESPAVQALSASAVAVYASAWWTGVVCGLVKPLAPVPMADAERTAETRRTADSERMSGR